MRNLLGVSETCSLPGVVTVHFDQAQAAPVYATVTASLFGFSVAGLVIGLSLPPRTARVDRAYATLAASLVPLILATLLYAEIAGTTNCGQVNLMTPFASFPFAAGAVLVFVAIYELVVAHYEAREAVHLLRRVVSLSMWIGILIGTLFAYVGADTLFTVTFDRDLHTSGHGWAASAILICSVVTAALLARVPRSSRTRSAGTAAALNFVLMLAVVSVVLAAVAAYVELSTWNSLVAIWFRVGAWSLTVIAVGVVLRLPPGGSPKIDGRVDQQPGE